jgi:hypothetical protein
MHIGELGTERRRAGEAVSFLLVQVELALRGPGEQQALWGGLLAQASVALLSPPRAANAHSAFDVSKFLAHDEETPTPSLAAWTMWRQSRPLRMLLEHRLFPAGAGGALTVRVFAATGRGCATRGIALQCSPGASIGACGF